MSSSCGTSRRLGSPRHWPLVFLLVLPLAKSARAETWAEKLGYPAGSRVLILHADDVGMCYEHSAASKQLLQAGHIQSAAAMVPCPWFNEFAAWYKEHSHFDVGLHLAMNSEWTHYRWGPVAPRDLVPGMVDPDGYLWRSVRETVRHASPGEIEREIRAQIERALSRGIRPGHVDTHMGTLYARLEFTRAYFKVAQEYRIPAMAIELTPDLMARFKKQGYPLTDETVKLANTYSLPKLDDFYSVPDGKTYEEKREKLFAVVRSLRPGITEIIFHPSADSEGLRKITGSWQQRIWDAQVLADPETGKLLKAQGVVLTNWKEMMKRFDERQGRQKRVEAAQ